MREGYIKIIFFVSLLLSSSCNILNPNPDEDYFPINVGNRWYYNIGSPKVDPWVEKTIQKSLNIENCTYYSWTTVYGGSHSYVDTIRLDDKGRLWKRVENEDHLWFDFTKDSGSIYSFPFFHIFSDSIARQFTVTINKDISIETPAGIFEKCIKFYFDEPIGIDEEMTYIFAPNVGLVQEVVDGWTSRILNTYDINN